MKTRSAYNEDTLGVYGVEPVLDLKGGSMLELVIEVLEVLNSGHEILEKIIGFKIVDVGAVIFIVWTINHSFGLKRNLKMNSTAILTFLTLVVSVAWAAINVPGVANIEWAKLVFAIGVKLAAISTLTYNILKPVLKPLVNRFYVWLRSKGVEVPSEASLEDQQPKLDEATSDEGESK